MVLPSPEAFSNICSAPAVRSETPWLAEDDGCEGAEEDANAAAATARSLSSSNSGLSETKNAMPECAMGPA